MEKIKCMFCKKEVIIVYRDGLKIVLEKQRVRGLIDYDAHSCIIEGYPR